VPQTLGDQLRDLLAQQVRAASDEAIRSGGQIPAEQVDALSRLARLVDLYQAAQPPPARKRWPVVMALASTLVIVSLLLFARVRETEIEADLSLSEVTFVLPTQQVLTEAMDLSTLGVSGLRKIELPRAADQIAQTLPSSDGAESALRLAVASDGKRQGTITLAPLLLPAEADVWVRHIGLPRQYRLSMKGTNTEFRADVNGLVRIALSGGGSAQLDLVMPDVAVMQSGENEVDLDLTLLDPSKNSFSTQLSARDLSFFHIDEFRDPNSTVVRRASTILSGTLNFESLNGLERKVRPGEMIQFENSELEIRTLRLQEDHIELKFHGRVRGMNVGSGETRRSLMPTWLEWLQARHSLSLLWGTALYLFSLALGALRWWRKPV
jgi:hypothetical protein